MNTIRSRSIVSGAAFVCASLVSAAPALAAPPAGQLLTQESCSAGGGTFTIVKNVKTCVTLVTTPYDYARPYANFVGDIVAYYDVRTTGADTVRTTQTQKGKAAVKTVQETIYGDQDMYVVTDSRTCTEYVYGEGYVSRDVSVCEALGLYLV